MTRTSHPGPIYEVPSGGAKACEYVALACALLLVAPGRGEAQAVHIVRLEFNATDDIGRFVPARVTARAGDVVRFRVVSGAPHNVAFEPRGLSPAVHDALNAALTGRSGDLSGPVLAQNGMEYRLVVPAIPPGHYAFYCTPHRAYDMRGELIVTK
jgi:plastocyanin